MAEGMVKWTEQTIKWIVRVKREGKSLSVSLPLALKRWGWRFTLNWENHLLNCFSVEDGNRKSDLISARKRRWLDELQYDFAQKKSTQNGFAFVPFNEDGESSGHFVLSGQKAHIRKTQESLQLSPVTRNLNVLTIGKRKWRQQKHFKKQLS